MILTDDVVELASDALAKLPCRDMKGVSVGFHDLDIMRRREAARAALEAARYGEMRELLQSGTVSLTSFDGHCVIIDYETREEAEQMFNLLSTIGAA